MARHSRSKLPETWKEDFKALTPYAASSKERDWLDQFLAHPDAEKAFEILGWEPLDRTLIYRVLFIYRVCRNAKFQAMKWDDILHDAERMKDVQNKLVDVAKYIVRLEAASREAGEFHGTFFELLVDVAPALKVEETVPPAEVIPTILRAIATSLPIHIRKSRRGPKPDRQEQQLLALPDFFRAEYNGNPHFDVVALLRNATFPKKDRKNARQIKKQHEDLRERLNPAPLKKPGKKTRQTKKYPKRSKALR